MLGSPSGSDGKESAFSAGDLGSIPELGRFFGEGIATHSGTLVWRIQWAEETGGLQFIRPQRVGHDWATNIIYVYSGYTDNC